MQLAPSEPTGVHGHVLLLPTTPASSSLLHGARPQRVPAAAAAPRRVVVERVEREDAVGAAVEALDGADEGAALRRVRAALAQAVEVPVGLRAVEGRRQVLSKVGQVFWGHSTVGVLFISQLTSFFSYFHF